MIPLRDDGCLDVERINKLPYDEKMEVISKLSENQLLYYFSTLPLYEGGNAPIFAVKVDYTAEDLIARGGGVDAFEFMKEMRRKYLKERV